MSQQLSCKTRHCACFFFFKLIILIFCGSPCRHLLPLHHVSSHTYTLDLTKNAPTGPFSPTDTSRSQVTTQDFGLPVNGLLLDGDCKWIRRHPPRTTSYGFRLKPPCLTAILRLRHLDT